VFVFNNLSYLFYFYIWIQIVFLFGLFLYIDSNCFFISFIFIYRFKLFFHIVVSGFWILLDFLTQISSLSILVDFTVVDVVKCCVKSICLPNTTHQYFTRFYNSVKDSPIFYKIL